MFIQPNFGLVKRFSDTNLPKAIVIIRSGLKSSSILDNSMSSIGLNNLISQSSTQEAKELGSTCWPRPTGLSGLVITPSNS